MIETGKQIASEQGLKHIRWLVGRAEDLEIEPASFQLITIGEAFHRLDQRLIAARSMQWLSPGGCLATLGVTRGTELWQQIVTDVVRKWTMRNSGKDGRSRKPVPGSGPAHYEFVMRDAGFEQVGSYTFVYEYCWTVESIFGYLYSTSYCSKRVLGGGAADFEQELEEALLAHDPSGAYREAMQFGYTLGRKPGK